MSRGMEIAFFGSSLVSAYWNGAATYYRGIIRALHGLGHRITFYEPDAYDRQQHRDIPDPSWARVVVYSVDGQEAVRRALDEARGADLIVKASGVGVFDELLEEAVLALQKPGTLVLFWDVDAPATLDRVYRDPSDAFRALIPRYDLVLTYGGGQAVMDAYEALGARKCLPVYNAMDPATHHPVPPDPRFEGELGFLGNRLPDREARVEEFFLRAASELPESRFVLGGSGWGDKPMPANVHHVGHVYTRDHNAFNCSARAVLNISRESMARYGFSPATRVFEAAGAAACLITDYWEGIEQFLEPGSEILVARDGGEVAELVSALTTDRSRAIGEAARKRVLAEHTYGQRAEQLERLLGVQALGHWGVQDPQPLGGIQAVQDADPPQHPNTSTPQHPNAPTPERLNARTPERLRIVILGLSITSSWGNGHATTYRGLVRELVRRGHEVLFLERDQPWYAANRDLPKPPYGQMVLYGDLPELQERFSGSIREADLVIVGSYVPEGVAVGEWVTAQAGGATVFYDIDTPVTVGKLERGDVEYLAPHLVPQYDLYLSFSGGPILERIRREFGARRACPLYCSFDPDLYSPEDREPEWDLGYLGTYSDDRQPPLDLLMLEPARRWSSGRFVVAGPLYPPAIEWPVNVARIEHLAPADHRSFYNRQKFTLNVTRAEMVRAGYSPSVRLFEAAACAVPIISDYWEGLHTFFRPGEEILVSRSSEETLRYLQETTNEERRAIGQRARERVLAEHTAAHRAAELEEYALELLKGE
jgi:spore maturation protein CgeB